MKKRIKYNWLFAIDDLGLQDDFAVYKAECDLKQHRKGKKELSINRIARAYLKRIAALWHLPGLVNNPGYIVGKEESINNVV